MPAQDLVLYKKFRNKEVASAARGLIGLFRELAPGMLEKRDRGRGADVEAAPLSYGAARVSSRVEGAELLQVRAFADVYHSSCGASIAASKSASKLQDGDRWRMHCCMHTPSCTHAASTLWTDGCRSHLHSELCDCDYS